MRDGAKGQGGRPLPSQRGEEGGRFTTTQERSFTPSPKQLPVPTSSCCTSKRHPFSFHHFLFIQFCIPPATPILRSPSPSRPSFSPLPPSPSCSSPPHVMAHHNAILGAHEELRWLVRVPGHGLHVSSHLPLQRWSCGSSDVHLARHGATWKMKHTF